MANLPASLAIASTNFVITHIDVKAVGEALQTFVKIGSAKSGVAPGDIKSVLRHQVDPATVKLLELLKAGMPMFDAVSYLSMPQAQRPVLTIDATIHATPGPTLEDIGQALFFVYFLLLTQARYPSLSEGTLQVKVPKFLTSVMQYTAPASQYMKLLSSFNPIKFDARWIRHVKFEGFGIEAMNRFGLGVAGYRLFTPFKCYRLRDGVSEAITTAYAVANKFATEAPSWQMHPVTRDPALLTKYGNFNKNLGNLILECFAENEITEMVTSKMLFSRPVRDPQNLNYTTWRDFPTFMNGERIFPAPIQ